MLGIVAFFVTIGVVVLGWLGVSSSLRLPAASVMVVTLFLQLAFILAQLFASGRVAIPVKNLSSDAWFFVIAASGVPGIFWANLAQFAGRPMDLVMPGFATPAINAVLFMFARKIQLRKQRQLVDGSSAA
jgi:hypothetical protein